MRDEVRVSVPAKLNLHLGVGPLRTDRYHELITVFHAVDLRDTVTLRPATAMRLTVRGTDTNGVPVDASNLAWRAARLYRDRRGGPDAVDITIDKRIPVAGGMAGGSGDAAATLVACAALNDDDDARLDDLAAELGSDVAFLLHGGTALGTGRGERVEPVAAPDTLTWVLAFADFGIAAADAYRECDRLRGAHVPPPNPPRALLTALAEGDVDAVAAHLHNDLAPAALSLRPQLRATLDAGSRAGALAAIVSGSGPTCAFLCRDETAVAMVTAALAPSCHATALVTGPALGACRR